MDDPEICSTFGKGMWLALQRIAGKLQEFGQERLNHQKPSETAKLCLFPFPLLSFPTVLCCPLHQTI